VLVLGPPYHWPLQDASVARITSEKVVWLWAASQKASWNDAIRLVNSGAVKLDDHTTEVEPLEHYRKAWSGIETRRSFNVLLRVSDELAAL
jgi:threonine dehydrogenase-like Zn-dependent dehydrogenase